MVKRLPLGKRVHAALISDGSSAAAALAKEEGYPDLFDRVHAVASEDPTPSFLHSALCAMSLPVRRPADEAQPIIRQDGQYTLVITPKAVLRSSQGRQELMTLGVPFGSLPRLILIHIMTEAVRRQSNHVVLGSSFTDWMHRMGYKTVSYGPRGSATLIRQQLDRLLACEWMIRWEREDAAGGQEFGVREIKLSNEYTGSGAVGGGFVRELILTPTFYDHLREHAVPLNEHAIRQLRDSATALDLYTWLAYRLPRLQGKRQAMMSWQQLAVHFGNTSPNVRKFRQTVRDAWERQVSGVYPEARAEFDTSVIRLYPSPPPLQQRAVRGAHLALLPSAEPFSAAVPITPPGATDDRLEALFKADIERRLGAATFKSWFKETCLVCVDNDWQLTSSSSFRVDWLNTHYAVEIEKAAKAIGLAKKPRLAVATR